MKVHPEGFTGGLWVLGKRVHFIDCSRITRALCFPFKAIKTIFSTITIPFRWAASSNSVERDYQEEFQRIKTSDIPTSAIDFSFGAKCPFGNRYFDVLPNEGTRVKIDGDPYFYFNANWVLDGTVIACQGPLSSDHREFWKMALYHEIQTVVMVTDLVEKGMEKCSQYWCFEGDIPFRQIGEELIYSNGSEQIVKREFEVGERKTIITQYHLKNFPDHGIVKPETLAQLVEITGKREGKILAHCSAGIGRTGTYCAALDAYRSKSHDMVSIVKKLRHPDTGRWGMIQTSAQYALACEATKITLASLPSRVWSAVWRSSRV